MVEGGDLHRLTRDIQAANLTAYMREIHTFVEDCNKTIEAIVHRFQVTTIILPSMSKFSLLSKHG